MLAVGPGAAFETPSAAARAAQDGDSVRIAAGEYFDCAVWRASHLTIEGMAGGTVLSDSACNGKAAFVVTGDDVTVRGLRFQRLRVPDGNGAGIRGEGHDLRVEDCAFDDDQVGILISGTGSLTIRDSRFTAIGRTLDGRPTHAVLTGWLDRLDIVHSAFDHARGGDHVVAAGAAIVLDRNRFSDDGGAMQGPLVLLHGGTLTLRDNVFSLAPGAAARPGAVLVTEAGRIVLHGNRLDAPDGQVALLRDWSGGDVQDEANTVPPGGRAVSDAGATYHRMRARAAALRAAVWDVARWGKHVVGVVLRSVGLLH